MVVALGWGSGGHGFEPQLELQAIFDYGLPKKNQLKFPAGSIND